MSILSFEFLLFVAAVIIVYYALPLKWRWGMLLLVSLAFYARSGWRGMAYMLCVAGATWCGAIRMNALQKRADTAKADDNPALAHRLNRRMKACLWACLSLCLGALVFVKYADAVFGAGQSGVFDLLVPLGLSYFTFQSVGYAIDVYWGKFPPQRNPLKYLLFVCFFPQMIQGPISNYPQLAPQLFAPKPFRPQAFTEGFQLALWGFFKKLVLADRLAPVCDALAAGGAERPGYMTLLCAALYAIRLYADFSGGMDIVRGVARMFGVELTINFNRPFFSTSVAEYWRRWHITLGAWFRRYVYYPLSASRFGGAMGRAGKRFLGNKAGRMLPGAVSTLVIFLLIGIWHTASWNALLYGAYFGLLMGGSMLLEPFFKTARNKLRVGGKPLAWRCFCLARTLALVLLSQFFAVSAHPAQAFSLMHGVFTHWSFSDVGSILTGLMPALEWYIALGAALLLLVVDILCERGVDLNARIAGGTLLMRWPVLIALIVVILVFGVYGKGYDAAAFLYTQF